MIFRRRLIGELHCDAPAGLVHLFFFHSPPYYDDLVFFNELEPSYYSADISSRREWRRSARKTAHIANWLAENSARSSRSCVTVGRRRTRDTPINDNHNIVVTMHRTRFFRAGVKQTENFNNRRTNNNYYYHSSARAAYYCGDELTRGRPPCLQD